MSLSFGLDLRTQSTFWKVFAQYNRANVPPLPGPVSFTVLPDTSCQSLISAELSSFPQFHWLQKTQLPCHLSAVSQSTIFRNGCREMAHLKFMVPASLISFEGTVPRARSYYTNVHHYLYNEKKRGTIIWGPFATVYAS